MSSAAGDFLSQPIVAPAGQPLRVAVYSRLADGIRSTILPLGSLLPKEVDLGVQMGVSRTVVREALMLLEEDGLIVTKRGVGRSVTDALPNVGLEGLRPFEDILSTAGKAVRVGTNIFDLQPTTDFISKGIEVDSTANTWFRESIAYRGDEPVAIIQEHIPAGKYLSDINPDIARLVDELRDGFKNHGNNRDGTLLSLIYAKFGPILGSGECEIAPGIAGPSNRARLLGLRSADPVLILTQRAKYAGTPLYLAKCVISPSAGHLTVVQSSPS
ncbi:hypothetical protein AL755_07575 [Arthrobacter sp. ERGS1:01]|uniref:GntR family transcriptional regulator n=1 Tax=Arthrobacter sp. ERGS1:01 TaxID=1704044 RepID=UPI0006B643CD|nr:GntR family transcriptional regulator [Arthrobacter sp. ERGS1:01]ALE05368.1 hypothetical protein AL755_07575 [Arthrobacter sp. ERGS1:01]